MKEQTMLWEKLKRTVLTRLCCESPGLYGTFTGIFLGMEEKNLSGTDGSRFYYSLEKFFSLYSREGNKGVLRFFLHSLFHVLYFHMNVKKECYEEEFYHLACDIVVEYTIDCLGMETDRHHVRSRKRIMQEIVGEREQFICERSL